MMKFIFLFLFFVPLVFGQTPEQLDRTLKKLAPDLVASTVAVMVGQGSGSGVIVTPEGLVITAAHVTSEPGKKMTVLLADGRELPATSLGVDHTTDGALLKIDAPGPFPFRPYLSEPNYNLGDWVIATGHPGGPVTGRPSPIRLGRILGAGTKSGFSDPILTNATVISGDSGGPLFNLRGEVIGINSNISMPWSANKHVPLPSIVEKWEELMKGDLIGAANAMANQQKDMFDEPYAELRKRFLEVLEEHPEDPGAAKFLKRPRLLDPHHMQAYLDRLAPDEEAPKAPRYGLKLDLTSSTPTIAGVRNGSPAAEAGLVKDDVVTSMNGDPIDSIVTLALGLKKEGPLIITTAGGKSVTLTPKKVPARRHFPQPVAGLISMMITDSPGRPPASIRAGRDQFLSSMDGIYRSMKNSIVEIKRDDELIIHATVISSNGELVTKASELEDGDGLLAHFEGQEYPIEIIGTDKLHDLALIKIAAPDLKPVVWESREPSVARLVFTPSLPNLFTGVITQPARSAPKKGYELSFTPNEPSAFLGVSFSPDTTAAVISGVDIGSPADRVGLLEGDEVVKINGKSIDSAKELGEEISEHAPGEKIALKIKRGDEKLTLKPILDNRPPASAGSFDRTAARRDDALSSLSARGGKLSKRRANFPRVLYHDQRLLPAYCGTPLFDRKGNVVGLNIARSLRHRSLALPGEIVTKVVEKLRR